MLFIPDQRVELIPSGEAVRIEFVLVLEHTLDQVAGHPDIQSPRLVRHHVNPESLHAFARIVPDSVLFLREQRSRSLALTEAS